jgi:hypothetical protein
VAPGACAIAFCKEMNTQDHTSRTKVESVFWATSAFELHVTARILWESYDDASAVLEERLRRLHVSSPYFLKGALARTIGLNAGLSLELFLKACVVERYGELPRGQFHHRLRDIATAGGVIFNTQELERLDILTEFIYWAGKYPSNKDEHSVENLAKKMQDSGVADAMNYTTVPIDLSVYEELWQKIAIHYQGIGGFGTLSPEGEYLKPFKAGTDWKVVKESQDSHSTSLTDRASNMTIVEAYILAEKLNHDRELKDGAFDERYYTDEMQ